MWACTPNGLYHSAGNAGGIRFERRELSLEAGGDFLYDCLVDRRGRLWIAAWGGLLRLEDGRLTRYTTRDGLLHNRVQHIVEGKDGSIWIGYADALGVSQLFSEGQRAGWRHYSRQDGLRSLKVFFLGCDSRGWIWLGTDQGVDVFDGQSLAALRPHRRPGLGRLQWQRLLGRCGWQRLDGHGQGHLALPDSRLGLAAAPGGCSRRC